MCQGRNEGEEDSTLKTYCLKEGKANIGSKIYCELCSSEASVYCQADDAYLCWKCDKWVHGANFLAQRHVRCLLCGVCRSLTRRFLVGTSSEVILPTVFTLGQRSRRRDADSESTDSRKEPFLFL
ncbi:B-box domain protein 30-like [Nicotiana tabacum]|uniref:B-box domain protein 30-like n=1 Tax=Nicotiana tabacum TaxID=4097 RepID=A0A1S3YS35_TOBAC|nr:B-box domain protein 30-like [Nicotiana tomentosiformis]XP_016455011.1 PREDICTED: zinc finger protein CONSTANS-LIKE 13-like [Nicotiana tabacum]